MAITETSKETTIMYALQIGIDSDNKPITRTKSISNINPSVTLENIYTLGSGITNLQKYPVASISRKDVIGLTDQTV